MDEPAFYLQLTNAGSRCFAALLRLLRYGSADRQAWHSLRGGLMCAADAIEKHFAAARVETATAIMQATTVDMTARQ